jgi:hypothetical protein
MRVRPDGTYDTVLSGKAYARDKAEYGDPLQMYDFLRVLGGENPHERGTEHRLTFAGG